MEHKPTVAPDGVVPQLWTLWRALRASRHQRQIGLLSGGIVLVVCLNAVGQIRLNSWQGAFYDAIEQRAVAAFTTQLLVFLVIAGGLLVLVVAQTWLQQMITVRLREWLTHDLLDQWLAPKRAYLLSFAGEIGVNPDQRIAQDALHLSELTAILGVGLLQSSLLLVSFVGVLWILSANVMFEVGGQSFAIPGYMVWCAIAYALGGSLLAWRIGRPLIPLNAERYQRESDLRFAMVWVNEHADGIALHGGEADERRILDQPADQVITMMTRLAGGIARLTWITSGYGWLAIVVPIIVAAPGYFDGELSFGALMMVVGAFNQV
jgi:putative ATP-binding cassette transporter